MSFSIFRQGLRYGRIGIHTPQGSQILNFSSDFTFFCSLRGRLGVGRLNDLHRDTYPTRQQEIWRPLKRFSVTSPVSRLHKFCFSDHIIIFYPIHTDGVTYIVRLGEPSIIRLEVSPTPKGHRQLKPWSAPQFFKRNILHFLMWKVIHLMKSITRPLRKAFLRASNPSVMPL